MHYSIFNYCFYTLTGDEKQDQENLDGFGTQGYGVVAAVGNRLLLAQETCCPIGEPAPAPAPVLEFGVIVQALTGAKRRRVA